ncbi:histidinol dehydrogenase [Devosia ginsengisoli]|uniref:histidinol dehydrogenase n=1 Tax=Devosia ginsengisoli TaxID=400770 RepID=UPI003CCC6918
MNDIVSRHHRRRARPWRRSRGGTDQPFLTATVLRPPTCAFPGRNSTRPPPRSHAGSRAALQTAGTAGASRSQKPEDHIYTNPLGRDPGTRWTLVDAVGIYVPGAWLPIPPSVLMDAMPDLVAGVEYLAMVVPTPDGRIAAPLLLAAKLARRHRNLSRRRRAGQSSAAEPMARRRSPRSTKIVGPGNALLVAAKAPGLRQGRHRFMTGFSSAGHLLMARPIPPGSPPT